MAKTGVIGAGSWGTALALVLHNNGARSDPLVSLGGFGGESFKEPGA